MSTDRKLLLLMEEYDLLPELEAAPLPGPFDEIRMLVGGEVYWVGEPGHVGVIPERQPLTVGNPPAIVEAMRTPEGRARLAAQMTQPLRLRRDYMGGPGRRTFLVEQLPEGALPMYDRDPEVSPYRSPQEASSPTPADVEGLRELLAEASEDPEFRVQAHPESDP